MKIIKKLCEMIDEEICDADKYANCAMKWKEEDRTLADTFYTLSNEELNHMEKLHTQVVRLINDYRSKNGEPPKEMLAVYNYLHEKAIEKTREVKVLLQMYKG